MAKRKTKITAKNNWPVITVSGPPELKEALLTMEEDSIIKVVGPIDIDTLEIVGLHDPSCHSIHAPTYWPYKYYIETPHKVVLDLSEAIIDKNWMFCCINKHLCGIILPDNCDRFGSFKDVVWRVENLETIGVTPRNSTFTSIDGVLYTKNGEILIACPRARKSITIPDSVKAIARYAFLENKALTNISIPENIIEISDDAFRGCTSLTAINVAPENHAFSSQDGVLYNKDLKKLIKCPEGKKEVTIPDSVTEIGDGAFECCTITSINLPQGLMEIGKAAFSDCNFLTDVKISENVTKIGDGAFARCLALRSINIGSAVEEIGRALFFWCKTLRTVTIPSSVKRIETRAFEYCEALTFIDIPEGLTDIMHRAFYHCTSLSSINIPSTIKKIESSAFDGCIALNDITIPASVKYIWVPLLL